MEVEPIEAQPFGLVAVLQSFLQTADDGNMVTRLNDRESEQILKREINRPII